MLQIKKCEGCKERERKIKAAANAVIEWIKNPVIGGIPPFHLIQNAAIPTKSDPEEAKKKSKNA